MEVGIYFMSNKTGISFFNDVQSAIVANVEQGLLIQVMTLCQDGSMKQCAILLNTPQVIELIEYLQPGTFTDNKDIFDEE